MRDDTPVGKTHASQNDKILCSRRHTDIMWIVITPLTDDPSVLTCKKCIRIIRKATERAKKKKI